MAEPIISVSGLRGVIGETLTPEVAIRYVTAFASTLPVGDVLIGRDSRPSGRMLLSAITSGLQSVGRNVIDVGIAATPTVGVITRQLKAAGAIQITASHNPPPYNGIKLFSAAGRVIPAGLGQKVLEKYRDADRPWVPQEDVGGFSECEDVVGAHLCAVLDTIDAERIRKRKFRVLLDSNHGAGASLGRRLLHELACKITIMGEEPNGHFAHPAEPTADNLVAAFSGVMQAQADVGFCQDPDADRLAIVDETGRYIGEEYTVAICANHVLKGIKGPMVTNCASSRMSADIAAKYDVPYFRSAVGEANVVDKMLAEKAAFGGEGNGGPIDPRVGYVRDSYVGMALILDAMAAREESIGRLADELPRYEIVKTKISLAAEGIPAALDALEKKFPEASADRLDGLRLDWADRWLLVRGSNTEPIVRAIAEAPTAKEAKGLCAAAAELIEGLR